MVLYQINEGLARTYFVLKKYAIVFIVSHNLFCANNIIVFRILCSFFFHELPKLFWWHMMFVDPFLRADGL